MVRLGSVSLKSVALWGLLSGVGIATLVTALFFSRPIQKQTTILPDVKLESLSGETVTLGSFEGKPLVINLWATWCGPCRRELPLFADMAKTHPSVTFLFVNQKETREQIEMFLQDEKLLLENVLLDTEGKLSQHFKVFGLPSTLFFDARGNLVDTQTGEASSVQLFNSLTDLTRP
jgi:thiol-disulfide isomerase/thioredoxin